MRYEHNHQEKYFQFYENKRWLTAQTDPLCVELPKDFHFLLNSKPKRWQCQYCKESFSIELNILSVSCQIQRRQHGFGRKWVSVGKRGHSSRFNCSRNLRTKEGKKSRQSGKSTNCPAFFTYKLYDCQKEEGIECFALKMKIEYVHNHEIQTTKAWSFLGVSKETVERYFQLFQDSYTPSKARLVYIAELKEKLGEEEFFKISLVWTSS